MLLARRFVSATLSSVFGRSIYKVPSCSIMTNGKDRFQDLSREELIKRLEALESNQPSFSSAPTKSSVDEKKKKKIIGSRRSKLPLHGNSKKDSKFDINDYPCRKIALRFSYDGAMYNGLATQNFEENENRENVVAVEDVLWKALCKTRLVGENLRFSDVGFSRCGRTDRGVSAGGQVVAMWVRSRKVDQWKERLALAEFVTAKKKDQGKLDEDDDIDLDEEDGTRPIIEGSSSSSVVYSNATRIPPDPESEELNYVGSLNSVLPPTIRIQAWSPVRPHFSARFDCRYRHYKYFFNSGCTFMECSTTKGPVPDLDISLMRVAAQKFLGEHDFRNFCKVDATKQITNYRRRIDGISIDEVSQPWPQSADDLSQETDGEKQISIISSSSNGKESKTSPESMFVLNLRGTAFLYHQVRHMVAILFRIGARLEKPSIIDELLNVEEGGVARDRLMMRKRGLVLEEREGGIEREDGRLLKTTLPDSTATTMGGIVASDGFLNEEEEEEKKRSDDLTSSMTPAESKLQVTTVYDRKPGYEMASDRPLMLWECGFKDSDIEWRSGTYDGPLRLSSDETKVLEGDINSSTTTTAALLHSHWSSLAITTEIYKHFLLALPLDISQSQPGYIPASNFYDKSARPILKKDSVSLTGKQMGGETPRIILPLGDGRFKPLQGYNGLIRAEREETFETKNANYLLGRGKRRAEKKEKPQPL